SDRGLLSPQLPASEAYHRAADYLRARAAPTDLIALMAIGKIGFETGLPTVDVTGLVTPWIAKSPGPFLNKQYPVGRLLSLNPRFILLRPAFPIDARIQNDAEFQARYRSVLALQLNGDVLEVYERAGPIVAD